jgi:cytochrome P450
VTETLRIEPPVGSSSPMCFTKAMKLGDYDIYKGALFTVYIYGLHHDTKEWIEPEKYIPERFDHTSSFYLTPNGNKRH